MPYVLFLEILEFPCQWTLFLVDFKIFKLPNVWLLTFIAFGFRIEGITSGGNQLTNTVKSSHREINLAQYLFKLTWTLLEWFWKSQSYNQLHQMCDALWVPNSLSCCPYHFEITSTQWQPRQGCWLFPASSWCWWYAALYHWWLFVSFKCLYCWHTMCFNFRGDRFLFYGCQYLTSLQEVKKPMAG